MGAVMRPHGIPLGRFDSARREGAIGIHPVPDTTSEEDSTTAQALTA